MVTALKIPKKYFAGTGIGTGFVQTEHDRDRDGKTRSRRTLLKGRPLNADIAFLRPFFSSKPGPYAFIWEVIGHRDFLASYSIYKHG